MLKVLTLLKTGGIYDSKHVIKIKEMLSKHTKIPYEFVCVTDLKSNEYKTIELSFDLEGWFSKMELFKIVGPCLYLDLDTIITNNIDSIIENCLNQKTDLITLKDPAQLGDFIGSGLMFWNNDLNCIFDTFRNNINQYSDPKFIFSKNKQVQPFGDQNIIHYILKEYNIPYSFFKEQGKNIVSFKWDLNFGRSFNLEKHKIVFFHGKPRPWEQKKIEY